MVFNSIDFFIFFLFFFLCYWKLKKTLKWQNLFLLLSSYFFYAIWDWRFLFLIVASSLVDFTIGLNLGKSNDIRTKKYLLSASIVFNLGLLGFFKYFNFFAENLKDLCSTIGYELSDLTLNIVLPVGISFYTFQTLSYTIDVYRNSIKPEKDVLSFFAFVSFFPQLVAGPIERASNLLPQISRKRIFDYNIAIDGSRQILWGLFKKVVIADNCAIFVNLVFDNPDNYSSFGLILGCILFAFQIYGDFSGYSDIAIGLAKLLGIKLKTNFKVPYFSRNIAEFWRRWHISLSTWFRDYLYIPLGGSRSSNFNNLRNILIIFLVSGFWHGANWTFVFWGFVHTLYFLPLVLLNKNRNYIGDLMPGRFLPHFTDFYKIIFTFFLTSFAWIFFRADTIGDAIFYIAKIISGPYMPRSIIGIIAQNQVAIFSILILVIFEWFHRNCEHQFDLNMIKSRLLRNIMYVTILFSLLRFPGQKQSFIYFQF